MVHSSDNNFIILSKKLLNKYNQVGFFRFQKIVIKNIFWNLNYLSPSFRRNIRSERDFDLQYGTDTSSNVQIADLDVSENIRKHSVRYEPTRVWLFDHILNQIPIIHENYVFIDFGSGKGRALLLASKFPFKKIIGIEASPKLCKIARENILRYKSTGMQCNDISCLCLDARDFKIINENTIFYLYNPFDKHVMGKVLSNIENSLKKYPRTIFLIYTNPKHSEVIDDADFLYKILNDKRYRVYRNVNSV
jgi:SAM-dependent methyltransferase